MDMNFVKLHEKLDREIKELNSRMKDLEKELESLRNQIKDTTIEKNLYNTSSTISCHDDEFLEWEADYGQQKFT